MGGLWSLGDARNSDSGLCLKHRIKRERNEREPWGRQPGEQASEPGRFDVEKAMLLIKNALWLYSELCFLCRCRRGAHFQKVHENIMPESEKWSQNYVRYIKIPPTWSRMHEDGVKMMSDLSLKSPKEATCSNNTHLCDVCWGSAWEAWRG